MHVTLWSMFPRISHSGKCWTGLKRFDPLRSNVPESGGVFCWPWPFDLAVFMENSMTSFERSRKRRCFFLTWPSRNDIRQKRLRFSRCMHEHSSARFQSASWVKRRDIVRTFQKATVFCFLTLTFWPRGVLADSWWNRRYVGVDAKRHMSKSSLYNVMMQYASYSLHARLRFSRCMHEHSSARFQSTSRVKMRDGVSFRERGIFHDVVRTFQKRRKNYMKPVQTGAQTRLEKRAIIVSSKPKTTVLWLLTLTLTSNLISTKVR